MSMLPELATWLRGLEAQSQAPAGQPNKVADDYGEVAAFLEASVDFANGLSRKLWLANSVKEHNADLVVTCDARRIHPTTPCGGSKGVRCPDCPRTLGLTGGNRTITG